MPSNEIWLPAWQFLLTRERTNLASQVEMDISQGDLEIEKSLNIRGAGFPAQEPSVRWRNGALADKVFELLGDYNGDGTASGTVGSEDFSIWQDTLGSTTDLRADGDDNGVVNQLDYNVWFGHFNRSLDLQNLLVA